MAKRHFQSWQMSFGNASGVCPKGTTWPVDVSPVTVPFAPGKVPKYSSNDRFSLTMKTICWMFPTPAGGACANDGCDTQGRRRLTDIAKIIGKSRFIAQVPNNMSHSPRL